MMMLYLDNFLCCLSLRTGVLVVSAAQMVESALIITHQAILIIDIEEHPQLRPWIPGLIIVWAVLITNAAVLILIAVLQERLNLAVIWMLLNIAFIFFFFIGVMSYLALGQWVIAVGYILALFFHLYASLVVFSYSNNLFVLQTVRDLVPYPIILSNPEFQTIEPKDGGERSPRTPCSSPRNSRRPPGPASQVMGSTPPPPAASSPPARHRPPQIKVFPRVTIPKPRPEVPVLTQPPQMAIRFQHSHPISVQV